MSSRADTWLFYLEGSDLVMEAGIIDLKYLSCYLLRIATFLITGKVEATLIRILIIVFASVLIP